MPQLQINQGPQDALLYDKDSCSTADGVLFIHEYTNLTPRPTLCVSVCACVWCVCVCEQKVRLQKYAIPPDMVHQPLFTSMFTKGVHQRRSPQSLVHHFGSPLWFTTSVHLFKKISESNCNRGGGNNRNKIVKNNLPKPPSPPRGADWPPRTSSWRVRGAPTWACVGSPRAPACERGGARGAVGSHDPQPPLFPSPHTHTSLQYYPV